MWTKKYPTVTMQGVDSNGKSAIGDKKRTDWRELFFDFFIHFYRPSNIENKREAR
jgi:hypothetical protein